MNIFDILNNLDKYRVDYQNSPKKAGYKEFADSIRDFDDAISLVSFSSSVDSNRIFLIVPSLFNSPNILNIGYPFDVITNLRSLGRVFLIDWKEVKDPNYKLCKYVSSSCKLLSELSEIFNQKIDLIGHCLGGNIALATTILKPLVINSITLLSTPWDFSFLSEFRKMHKKLDLDYAVRDLDHIPAVYFQILFFLMNQSSFAEKIESYLNNKNTQQMDDFFAIEQWQFSGNDLPRGLYIEIMDDIIERNVTYNNLWKIGDITIDPSLINKQAIIVTGKKDKIVPNDSSKALGEILQHSTKFEYDTGHIGYLVGSQRKYFMLDLINALKNG